MAANDLTNLADVKGWLNINDTNSDTLLTRLITAASQFMQTWMNRTIAEAAYTETRNGVYSDRIAVANFPLVSVSSVTVDGQAILPSPDGIQAGYVFDQRFIYQLQGKFTRGTQNVQLAYTAGYVVVPFELEQACIELVSWRYREKDRIGMSSKGLAGETTTFSLKDIPPTTLAMLNNYKKVIPV